MTTVAMENHLSITYFEYVCSPSYPTSNVYVPYFAVICCLFGSTIFFHIILYRQDLKKKKVIEHKMCVLTFSTTFVRNVSLSTKNSEIYYHKHL